MKRVRTALNAARCLSAIGYLIRKIDASTNVTRSHSVNERVRYTVRLALHSATNANSAAHSTRSHADGFATVCTIEWNCTIRNTRNYFFFLVTITIDARLSRIQGSTCLLRHSHSCSSNMRETTYVIERSTRWPSTLSGAFVGGSHLENRIEYVTIICSYAQ